MPELNSSEGITLDDLYKCVEELQTLKRDYLQKAEHHAKLRQKFIDDANACNGGIEIAHKFIKKMNSTPESSGDQQKPEE